MSQKSKAFRPCGKLDGSSDICYFRSSRESSQITMCSGALQNRATNTDLMIFRIAVKFKRELHVPLPTLDTVDAYQAP